MFAYPSNNDLLKASHTCGALATVALIMLNYISSLIKNEIINHKLFFKLGLTQLPIIK